MFDLLITNGTLVDSHGMYQANLGIVAGKISSIYQGDKEVSAERTIDASKNR